MNKITLEAPATKSIKQSIRRYTPDTVNRVYDMLKTRRKKSQSKINFGDLRRLTPISPHFGFDRGLPVDRYYIEKFLDQNKQHIKGRVLEIKDDAYTKRFGGNAVTQSDVLDIDEENPLANIIADLAEAEDLPANTYDCAIITQTLLLIYDVPSAIKTLHRILKPGGVCLITVPGITKVPYESLGHTWHWSFTLASMKRLIDENFPSDEVLVESQGNVLAAISFLMGLSVHDLETKELDYHDPEYQVIVSARIKKTAN